MPSLSDELRTPSLDQAVKNHMKVARAAIVLKHRIAADNELAVVLPVIRKRLAAQLQNGHIEGITFGEMLELLDGEE